MPNKKRTYNTRLIRRDFSYEVAEIVELLSIHENSVRAWLAAGLPAIDTKRPVMVHGTDLIAFLSRRQFVRKRRCATDEMFCCRCRVARRPWECLVDLEIQNDRRVALKGVCSVCGGRLNRAGAMSKLAEYERIFKIQTRTDRRLKG